MNHILNYEHLPEAPTKNVGQVDFLSQLFVDIVQCIKDGRNTRRQGGVCYGGL